MFNEKTTEWSNKQGKEIPVWQSDKYKESRDKAIEVIKSGKYGLSESDFWILMNETKSGKMAYTGLIISHNGCLKINDALSDKFKPECVSYTENGWSGSLVYTYCSTEQGLFEVGEVSSKNCKIDYPYAMALKRMFDRVVLKLSKLAYAGIYGEDEADEFRNPLNEPEAKETADKTKETPKRQSKPKEEPKPQEKQQTEEEINAMFLPTVEASIQNQDGVEYGICSKCGSYVYQVKTKTGFMPLRDFMLSSMRNFGQILCKDCYSDAVKAAKAK